MERVLFWWQDVLLQYYNKRVQVGHAGGASVINGHG
jgi:hypothetical protein